MAKVHDVDPNLIERTRRWLLDQQKPDGSWEPEGHSFHGGPAELGERPGPGPPEHDRLHRLVGLLRAGGRPEGPGDAGLSSGSGGRGARRPVYPGLDRQRPAGHRPRRHRRAAALDRLESLRQTSKDGKLAWWGPADSASFSRRTLFFGAGESRRIETTAMAVLALVNASRSPESVRGALAWLVAQKDGHGTWGSTQATVLALKALLAGTGKPLGGDKPRRIAILLDGEIVQELAIPADQSDVLRQVDLSDRVASAPGTHRLTIEDRSGTDSGYQVVFRYHEPDTVDRPDANGRTRVP